MFITDREFSAIQHSSMVFTIVAIWENLPKPPTPKNLPPREVGPSSEVGPLSPFYGANLPSWPPWSWLMAQTSHFGQGQHPRVRGGGVAYICLPTCAPTHPPTYLPTYPTTHPPFDIF